jgi:predicted esterase
MAAVYACLHEESVKGSSFLRLPFIPLLQTPLNKHRHSIQIFHGWQDEVVPIAAVQSIAEQLFVNCKFNAVEDDHSLHSTFASLDWDALLS